MSDEYASMGMMNDAASFVLDPAPASASQVVAGAPLIGEAVLGDFDGMEVGVWEISPGSVRDTEVDELSVILSGDATIEFLLDDEDGNPTDQVSTLIPPIVLGPGSVLRLHKGQRTIWTIRETLRKVYLVP
jgi:uncharacterized cupin superfamily protein